MLTLVFIVVIYLWTVTFHEMAHGYVAYLLGDRTAQRAGRLSLNPLRHIDPFWTVLFPAFLYFTTAGRFMIGMAKPVPVDYYGLRSPRFGMMLVAFAGPLANLIFAALLNILYQQTGMILFLYAIYFNLGLAVFNLIPIPPLDGSKVVAGLLPKKATKTYMRLEPYGFWIILALYISGILVTVVIPGVNFFCELMKIPRLEI